jgi:hypothetical protein
MIILDLGTPKCSLTSDMTASFALPSLAGAFMRRANSFSPVFFD